MKDYNETKTITQLPLSSRLLVCTNDEKCKKIEKITIYRKSIIKFLTNCGFSLETFTVWD